MKLTRLLIIHVVFVCALSSVTHCREGMAWAALLSVLARGRFLLTQKQYEQALDWYDRAIATRRTEARSIAKDRDDQIACSITGR